MKRKKTVTMLLRVLGGIVGALAVLVVVVLSVLLYFETHLMELENGGDYYAKKVEQVSKEA